MPPDVKVTAPYNFVPLSRDVLCVGKISGDLAGLPSQDIPQKVTEAGAEPLSGEIPFVLEVPPAVPILVAGGQKKDEKEKEPRTFLKTPGDNGKPVDPRLFPPRLDPKRSGDRNIQQNATGR